MSLLLGVDVGLRCGMAVYESDGKLIAPRPKSVLGDDVAEAILIGLWGVLKVGWLKDLPERLGK